MRRRILEYRKKSSPRFKGSETKMKTTAVGKNRHILGGKIVIEKKQFYVFFYADVMKKSVMFLECF
jgi:hypothetical protein